MAAAIEQGVGAGADLALLGGGAQQAVGWAWQAEVVEGGEEVGERAAGFWVAEGLLGVQRIIGIAFQACGGIGTDCAALEIAGTQQALSRVCRSSLSDPHSKIPQRALPYTLCVTQLEIPSNTVPTPMRSTLTLPTPVPTGQTLPHSRIVPLGTIYHTGPCAGHQQSRHGA